MRKLLVAVLGAVVLASGGALADEFAFLSHEKVNLAKLLPPPPPPNSEAQKRDLAAVLELQRARTPEQITRALADNELSIFRVMEVLGPAATAGRLPVTVQFFKRVHTDVRHLINATKD